MDVNKNKIIIGRGELGYYVHYPFKRKTKECLTKDKLFEIITKEKQKGADVQIMTGYQTDPDLQSIIDSI